MTDLLDFLPLRSETMARIRARMDADVNAGYGPDDPSRRDTTLGGFYWDLSQVAAMEAERLWDMASIEIPAAAFPTFAFGRYLDEHGATYNLPRTDNAKATGQVTFTGPDDTVVGAGIQLAREAADPLDDDVIYQTTEGGVIASGTVTLPVEALLAGLNGNAPTGSVTTIITGLSGVAAINAAPISGGADVETDEDYRTRLLNLLQEPQGAGTVADYERWALAYPGVGFVTVTPLASGPGTVTVTVTDDQNSPVSPSLISGLQDYLDPVPGEGRGQAPVGAIVTVATPTSVAVAITAKIEHDDGYTLDGTAGTIETRSRIMTALTDYVSNLGPGQEVVLAHIIGALFRVPGVHDVSVTAPSANVAITASQVADLGTVTLTQGTVP